MIGSFYYYDFLRFRFFDISDNSHLPRFNNKFHPIFDEPLVFLYELFILINIRPNLKDKKLKSRLISPVIGLLTLDMNSLMLYFYLVKYRQTIIYQLIIKNKTE